MNIIRLILALLVSATAYADSLNPLIFSAKINGTFVPLHGDPFADVKVFSFSKESFTSRTSFTLQNGFAITDDEPTPAYVGLYGNNLAFGPNVDKLSFSKGGEMEKLEGKYFACERAPKSSVIWIVNKKLTIPGTSCDQVDIYLSHAVDKLADENDYEGYQKNDDDVLRDVNNSMKSPNEIEDEDESDLESLDSFSEFSDTQDEDDIESIDSLPEFSDTQDEDDIESIDSLPGFSDTKYEDDIESIDSLPGFSDTKYEDDIESIDSLPEFSDTKYEDDIESSVSLTELFNSGDENTDENWHGFSDDEQKHDDEQKDFQIFEDDRSKDWRVYPEEDEGEIENVKQDGDNSNDKDEKNGHGKDENNGPKESGNNTIKYLPTPAFFSKERIEHKEDPHEKEKNDVLNSNKSDEEYAHEVEIPKESKKTLPEEDKKPVLQVAENTMIKEAEKHASEEGNKKFPVSSKVLQSSVSMATSNETKVSAGVTFEVKSVTSLVDTHMPTLLVSPASNYSMPEVPASRESGAFSFSAPKISDSLKPSNSNIAGTLKSSEISDAPKPSNPYIASVSRFSEMSDTLRPFISNMSGENQGSFAECIECKSQSMLNSSNINGATQSFKWNATTVTRETTATATICTECEISSHITVWKTYTDYTTYCPQKTTVTVTVCQKVCIPTTVTVSTATTLTVTGVCIVPETTMGSAPKGVESIKAKNFNLKNTARSSSAPRTPSQSIKEENFIVNSSKASIASTPNKALTIFKPSEASYGPKAENASKGPSSKASNGLKSKSSMGEENTSQTLTHTKTIGQISPFDNAGSRNSIGACILGFAALLL